MFEALSASRPVLKAVAPGPFSTIQDMGRIGWRRFGVTGAGAMDAEALATANVLVGNRFDAAAVEFGHAGGEWAVAGASCRIAVAGGSFPVTVGGRPGWKPSMYTRKSVPVCRATTSRSLMPNKAAASAKSSPKGGS